MKRHLAGIGLLAALFMAGCDGVSPVAAPDEQTVLTPEELVLEGAPAGKLALSVDGTRLQLGGALETAFVGNFSKPSGAYAVSELPSGFSQDFRAIGWERDSRHFVALGLNDQLLLAMDIREQLTGAELTRRTTAIEELNGAPSVSLESESSTVLIWEGSGERLVLVQVNHPREGKAEARFSMTVALGRPRVMNQMGMGVADLREDMKVADGLRRQGKVTDTEAKGDGVEERVTAPGSDPEPAPEPATSGETQAF